MKMSPRPTLQRRILWILVVFPVIVNKVATMCDDAQFYRGGDSAFQKVFPYACTFIFVRMMQFEWNF